MQTIKKLYRSEYAGENVITNLTYSSGSWNQEKEWIPNAITNNKITSQAIAIGNGPSREEFDLTLIANHKGGLLGANKLQTYGTNSLYKTFKPDFLVADKDAVKDIAKTPYCKNNIVYASADAILDNPGKFYLIPQDPHWNAGSIAVYLAAFDGHSKIYLMGFDGLQEDDKFYEESMLQIFRTYPDVDFVRVMPTKEWYMPESWKGQVNLRQLTFREFVLEADIG